MTGAPRRPPQASNVVLDHHGHAKLVDLGFAKALPPVPAGAASPAARARARTFLGTAHALAPEMLARAGHDLPVDWWAVGVLGWEMLLGEPPFGYGSHDTGGQAGLFARIRAGLSPALLAPVHARAGTDVAALLSRLLEATAFPARSWTCRAVSLTTSWSGRLTSETLGWDPRAPVCTGRAPRGRSG